jgi:hypothetical protein
MPTRAAREDRREMRAHRGDHRFAGGDDEGALAAGRDADVEVHEGTIRRTVGDGEVRRRIGEHARSADRKVRARRRRRAGRR